MLERFPLPAREGRKIDSANIAFKSLVQTICYTTHFDCVLYAHRWNFPIFNEHANSRLKIVYSDMAHINDIESIGRADVFVNLAWEGTSHFGRDNRAIQTDNFSHTLQAMRVSKKLGCELFVESGSQAEYGYVNDLITEETLCHPESEYGKAKLKVWTEGRVLANELHIKYIHLRIFSVFGENDHPWTLVISSISKMLHNEDIDLTSCIFVS